MWNIISGSVQHGGRIEITDNGTGILYELSNPIRLTTRFHGTAGLHIEKKTTNIILTENGFEEIPGAQGILLPISVGFSQVLFNEMLAGSFRPVIFLETGEVGLFKGSIKSNLHLGDWKIKIAGGLGVEFHQGIFRNTIRFGYMSNSHIGGNLFLSFSVIRR